jgi:large subunit ribosomal protein L18e|tara:strand:+ start:181 stop:543 length:363 start_codon:yes stop_codon:yes gene_type:complete
MKKSKSTNVVLLTLIEEMLSKSREFEARIWRDIAGRISKSSKLRAEINIGNISRFTNNNDIIAIPGKVLGDGDINHKVTVAALNFSVKGKLKIKAAGGKCLSFKELMKEHPKGSNVRIMR